MPMLDVLRTLAIALVLGRHIPNNYIHSGLVRAWHVGGWTGVDLFFVLSGFLVASLLFNEHKLHGQCDVRRFLIRRGLKIYPAFYLYLALTMTFWLLVQGRPWTNEFLIEAMFLRNYFMPNRQLWGHTWSLGVEEHFYLLLTLMVAALQRRTAGFQLSLVIPACVCIAGLCFAMRLSNHAPNCHPAHTYYQTHLRVDSLFAGVALAYWFCFHNASFLAISRRMGALLPLLALFCFAPAFIIDLRRYWLIGILDTTILSLGSACLVMWAVPHRCESRWLTWVGAIGVHSYSIYLWHAPANYWFAVPAAEATSSSFVYFLIYIPLSVSLGISMSWLIERPALMFRDHYYPSKTRSSQTLPADSPESQRNAAIRGIFVSRNRTAHPEKKIDFKKCIS